MSDGFIYAVVWSPMDADPLRSYGAVPGRIDASANADRRALMAETLLDGGAAAAGVVPLTPGQIARLEGEAAFDGVSP